MRYSELIPDTERLPSDATKCNGEMRKQIKEADTNKKATKDKRKLARS